MLKKVKKIAALMMATMALSTLFVIIRDDCVCAGE